MHDDVRQVYRRVDRFIAERLVPALYRDSASLTVQAWDVPDEPVSFTDALKGDFRTIEPGTAWGRPWGTTWLRITGSVPAGWITEDGLEIEAVVDLGFNDAHPGFQTEGMAYTPDGRIIKAIEPRNRAVPLQARPGDAVEFYVEAASNPDISQGWSFRPTKMGDKATAGSESLYRLGGISVAALDREVWELAQDFWTLRGLLRELPVDLPRRAELLRGLERAIDVMNPHDVAGTAAAGRAVLSPLLASPAYASAHRIHAVGHAHIDSAWLWPVRETARKIARTFSNVLELMEHDDDFTFAASSAQQYSWLKEFQPELFERVRARVAEGRFIPVGGMWVEADTNMPGGESLARQFVAGKRFFMEEFGVEPLEAWLPDSFGYSAALPQIVAAAGSRWFLTQKLSWNEVNVMPHHTFRWSGIDGTEIFTHFPPVDTYNSELSGKELARAQRQYREKGAANTSLVPFGWGDGGGGPTREMLAAAHRTANLEGSPAVVLSSPRQFFEAAEAEYEKPPVWSGELYLEFHRGVLTSQAKMKQGNRRSERLLREAELWATAAMLRCGTPYPYDRLETAWHTVLLQQFHDILPGTSIAWVHREAQARYAEVARDLEELIDTSLRALLGIGQAKATVNAGPFNRDGVPAFGSAVPQRGGGVHMQRSEAGFRITTDRLHVAVDCNGLITSLRDVVENREALPPGSVGNLLQLFRDTPDQWDAWDIDNHYRRNVEELREAEEVSCEERDGQAVIRTVRKFGASRIVETLTVTADSPSVDLRFSIDWHERQKLLKLAVPLDIHADRAASEIQFGHIFRPTHTNTSWDAARFEAAAQRWVFVGEPGFGVAVANDSSYGHDVERSTRDDGGTTTQVRVSLLRAPLFPDPESDQGQHELGISLRLGTNVGDAIDEGYRLNVPLREIEAVGSADVVPLFTVDNSAVVIEAVKAAEDRSGDVVVRLYESRGGRSRARLTAGFPVTDVTETDLLERPCTPRAGLAAEGHEMSLELRPFQLVTLRLKRA